MKSTKIALNAQPEADVISFYRANERPYGVLSNLYRREIEFEGRIFPTSEHAYQAGKALKPAVREWILAAPSPSLAAMAAHGLYTWDVVPNWASIKFDRMRGVLRAKFTQHSDLAQILVSTGTKRLVEVGSVNNAVNRLWGEINGKGKNMLGIMLMELRDQISGHTVGHAPRSKREEAVDQQQSVCLNAR
ncbi:NADAR family protein [Mesorhizobium sp. WSM4307]|uniref:NADAR family protein n=1 Tax=unclassified Mesorhizobium TaxID=325217 RepID=UPI00115F6923|nr:MULTISPECIES: NADAR family protein [unclassified Mesorhizobium]TRC77249.1 NADAR family protein [Mesorhizobium sp. WSM4315]TRC86673.1 NADAR family protein [Mesorhizobium sp. WSM4307]